MSKTLVRSLRLTILALSASFLFACGTYVPEGATVISIENSPQEFERATIRPSGNELAGGYAVQMRWYDTNKFLTTATLTPGQYTFQARNFDGGGFTRDFQYVAGTDLYEFQQESRQEPGQARETAAGGPQVSGRIVTRAGNRRLQSVSVLFVGQEIVLRTAPVAADGTFAIEAPRAGAWKVQVHHLGPTPISYEHPLTQINSPINLGNITLQ